MGSYPCRKALCETLISLGKENRDILAVTADARGSAALEEFVKELPQQFVEVGIAEQNEVGVAAGLASCGKIPFVCSPAPFLSARSLEQVKVDVGYSGMNVKLVGISGGLAYGALGSSHHAIHDIAVMRALNGLTVILPADSIYMRWLVKELSLQKGGVYVRVGRGPVPDVYTGEESFQIGKANLLHEGNDITVIACGDTVYYALQAAKALESKGVAVRVLDMHTIKPIDKDAILRAAKETGKIITVEEHCIYGGLGGAVAEVTAVNCPVPLKILGLPDEHIQAGTQAQLFEYYGIETNGIVKAVEEMLSV
ncbi:transketolase family protein [Youxingia wuxianensis]|uniref:Transketolase family protein n=1 Tax=Youxingia wuxianensis TaxID=2763678 RepID=A0A926IGX7_9FIRM|nr:transketolase C-terminal domain-containing protein [Youxingia wuxianensis]MBC8584716.1 transketolase family protein [Youxingia wuxianensis]